ncbi:MAG: tail fiber domain-containing protein [Verrucomicrobia bacterium]|nr:tail fiber domain-containing protein [Verrucomicrobiota bacterium]NDA25786.1 tail fiber domain-containing protein [Verrucomicrobiota bacterium]NDD81678.1 tail fiber domain-containing protein [Verrucomicrobiota bacterium]
MTKAINLAQAASDGNLLGTGDNNIRATSIGVGTAASGTAGEIRATNNVTAYYSDDRLKTKIAQIEGALTKVMLLSGFYFEPNQTAIDLGYQKIKQVGLSAQQVQLVEPTAVVPAPISEKYLAVQYEKLIPLLVEAIKELKQQLDEIKNHHGNA